MVYCFIWYPVMEQSFWCYLPPIANIQSRVYTILGPESYLTVGTLMTEESNWDKRNSCTSSSWWSLFPNFILLFTKILYRWFVISTSMFCSLLPSTRILPFRRIFLWSSNFGICFLLPSECWINNTLWGAYFCLTSLTNHPMVLHYLFCGLWAYFVAE